MPKIYPKEGNSVVNYDNYTATNNNPPAPSAYEKNQSQTDGNFNFSQNSDDSNIDYRYVNVP